MTRKDYEKLAFALTQAKLDVMRSVAGGNHVPEKQRLGIERMHAMYAQQIADILKADNPNFRVDTFAAASCANIT